MSLIAWIVVLDDVYYIDMCLKSIIPYVDGIFILDEGCTDGSIELAKEIIGDKVPLHIEYCPTGLPKFDSKYNEPHFRSFAIQRAEEVFHPDWLLQIDADEIFTPYFFKTFKELETSDQLKKYMGIKTATERFITPCWRSQAARALSFVDGVNYYDSHVRCWRAGLGVRYAQNPGCSGYFHCVLRPDPQPVLAVPGVMHCHFHRSFGSKAEPFWREAGDQFEDPAVLPFSPADKAPQWFRTQMEEAIYTPYPWPRDVVAKWRRWGQYPGYNWDKDWTKEFEIQQQATIDK